MLALHLFERNDGVDLVAFADANYAEKATDMRSVSGGVVTVLGCGCELVI